MNGRWRLSLAVLVFEILAAADHAAAGPPPAPAGQSGQCLISQGSCVNSPSLVGTFLDSNPASSTAVTCVSDAAAIQASCGNPTSVTTTAAFYTNGVLIESQASGADLPQLGWRPSDIRTSLGLNSISNDGTGQTIAIVDADGSSTLAADYPLFCNAYGLSHCDDSLTIADFRGTCLNGLWDPVLDGGDYVGSDTETTADVELAHAIAPGATILLVLTCADTPDLFKGVAYAASHAKIVSLSFGAPEDPGSSGDGANEPIFASGHDAGVTFFASSGDYGPQQVIYPATSPNVVAVGGVNLTYRLDAGTYSESAQDGYSWGTSAEFSRPAYQNGWSSANGRAVPDMVFNGNNYSIYLGHVPACHDNCGDMAQGGWMTFGGTSASAPIAAALTALANQTRAHAIAGPEDFYQAAATGDAGALNSTAFTDIVTGCDLPGSTNCATSGFDPITGLGQPLLAGLVGLAPDAGISDAGSTGSTLTPKGDAGSETIEPSSSPDSTASGCAAASGRGDSAGLLVSATAALIALRHRTNRPKQSRGKS